MKLKAAISSDAPGTLFEEFGSPRFANAFLQRVVGDVFGVPFPTLRPAEFYVQVPDRTIRVHDRNGVEVRLTGVSRTGRPAKAFHDALEKLEELVVERALFALQGCPDEDTVQIFIVMMLDGEIETVPGLGHYSSVLERGPVRINKNGPLDASY